MVQQIYRFYALTMCMSSATRKLFSIFWCNSFFDQFLGNIYELQNDGTGIIFKSGDFNSRCGDLEYFISGVDSISARNVVNYNINKCGDLWIIFLVNTHICILNGRSFISYDFTSMSIKGKAVVDYCIVSHDGLDLFPDFSDVHVTDMISSIPNLDCNAISS